MLTLYSFPEPSLSGRRPSEAGLPRWTLSGRQDWEGSGGLSDVNAGLASIKKKKKTDFNQNSKPNTIAVISLMQNFPSNKNTL